MYGRAKDFAVYGFPANAHQLRLLPTYTSMDAMASLGLQGLSRRDHGSQRWLRDR